MLFTTMFQQRHAHVLQLIASSKQVMKMSRHQTRVLWLSTVLIVATPRRLFPHQRHGVLSKASEHKRPTCCSYVTREELFFLQVFQHPKVW